MRIINTVIIIILFVLVGCAKKVKDYEQDVFDSVINHLVDVTCFYAPAPPPELLLSDTNSAKYFELKREYDLILRDFFRKIDTVKKYLYINDTLQTMNVVEYEDVVGQYLDIECFDKEKKPNELQNMQWGNKDKFTLISSGSSHFFYESGMIDGDLHLGYFTFSRIVFNQDYTQGIFYYNFLCGSKCGEKVLVIVSNINNKWKIEEKIILEIF